MFTLAGRVRTLCILRLHMTPVLTIKKMRDKIPFHEYLSYPHSFIKHEISYAFLATWLNLHSLFLNSP